MLISVLLIDYDFIQIQQYYLKLKSICFIVDEYCKNLAISYLKVNEKQITEMYVLPEMTDTLDCLSRSSYNYQTWNYLHQMMNENASGFYRDTCEMHNYSE